MKENKYDDAAFFEKYSRMPRSREGLAAAGEWHALRKMFPDFKDRRVLDLGCGFRLALPICRRAGSCVRGGRGPVEGCWPRPGP